MIDPLAVGLTIEYVVESDRKSVEPTIWVLGALDSFTQSKLASSFFKISMDGDTPKVEKNMVNDHPDFLVVKHGLKGFKNFGNIEFKTEKSTMFNKELNIVPDEILGKIPLDVIHELAQVIWKGNNVSEDLRKN